MRKTKKNGSKIDCINKNLITKVIKLKNIFYTLVTNKFQIKIATNKSNKNLL